MRTRGLFSMLGVAALTVAAVSRAQVVDVSDCRAIDDLQKRLACYDRLADTGETPAAAKTERSRAAEASRPEASRGGDTSSTADGARATPARAAAASARSAAASTFASGDRNGGALTGKIASLEQYGPQMWLIALEGGQRWRQTIGKPYRLHVGDEVRVYSTRWGDAYRLSAERIGGYIQVVRVD